MAKDDELYLIDLAEKAGIVPAVRAGHLRSELQMFPGQNAGRLMVQRRLISEEQLVQLRQQHAGGGAAPAQAAPPQAAPSISGPPPRPALTAAHPTAPPMTQPPPARPPAVAAAPAAAPPASASATGTLAFKITAPANDPKGQLTQFLQAAREAGCSDLHISVNREPFVRRQARIEYLAMPPLSPEHAEALNFAFLDAEQRERLISHHQIDFALELPGLGRHRCNVYKQRVGWEGVFRIVPNKVPSFEELNLPPALRKLTDYHQGMIIVTGPSGSGKTTTVAAMLDLINRGRTDHIITVEDPVEYIFGSKKCQVTQREVKSHTESFGSALRAALREDPDVILIGEMRDLETISIATSAAETGHLVFGTLHTNSTTRTVARIMDAYPPEQREQVCTMVSETIRGVCSQQLIPRKDGRGLALAMEVLIFTRGVAAQVKEGKTHQLASMMQTGKKIGMKLMDDALMELYQQNAIAGREAYLRAENKPLFESIKEK